MIHDRGFGDLLRIASIFFLHHGSRDSSRSYIKSYADFTFNLISLRLFYGGFTSALQIIAVIDLIDSGILGNDSSTGEPYPCFDLTFCQKAFVGISGFWCSIDEFHLAFSAPSRSSAGPFLFNTVPYHELRQKGSLKYFIFFIQIRQFTFFHIIRATCSIL